MYEVKKNSWEVRLNGNFKFLRCIISKHSKPERNSKQISTKYAKLYLVCKIALFTYLLKWESFCLWVLKQTKI